MNSDSHVTFSHAAISMAASGASSEADLTASHASGALDSLAVEASGYSAEAHTDLNVSAGSLTVGDVSVTSSNELAYAHASLTGADFGGGAIAVAARNEYSEAFLDIIHATGGAIDGLSVEAGGIPRHESQGFDYFGYFGDYGNNDFRAGRVLTLEIDGVTLSHTLTAADVNRGFSADLSYLVTDFNAQAAAAGLGVTIGGNGGLTVDFHDTLDHTMSVFAVDGDDDIDDFEYDGGGQGYRAEATALIEGGSQVTAGGLIHIAATGEDTNAALTVASNSFVTFDHAAISVTASGASSDAELHTSYNASGTVDSLSVAAINDGADAYGNLTTLGTLTLGATSVSATANHASAQADLDGAAFSGGAVAVTAKGMESSAQLDANHATGTINGLSVNVETARGGWHEEQSWNLGYHLYDYGDVTAGTVLTLEIDGVTLSHTITQNEVISRWSADLGHIAADFNNQASLAGLNVTVSNNYDWINLDFTDYLNHDSSIMAVGGNRDIRLNEINGGSYDQYAEASALFHGGSDVTVGGAVEVSAAATGADASFYVNNDSQVAFDHAAIQVSAGGTDAQADLGSAHASGSIDSLALTASGNFSSASVDLSASGTLTLGDTSVNASDHSYASAELTGVTFSHATIEVTSTNSDAGLNANQASGTIDSLTVSAQSSGAENDAWAGAFIQGSSDVTVGDLTVTADGTYAEAGVSLGWDFSADSSFQLANSAIAVTANGRSHASLDVNYATGTIDGLSVVHNGDGATPQHEVQWFQFDSFFRREVDFTQGKVITLTVDGVTLNHTITASEENAGYENSITSVAADLNSKAHAAGLEITVSDDGNGELQIEFGDYQNHELSVVNCDGTDGKWYWADLENPEEFGAIALIQGESNVTVGGTVEVAATGDSGYASLNIASNSHATFDQADLQVTASGVSSEAYLETHANASGTVASLAVEASGDNAYADVTLTAGVSSVLTMGNVGITGTSYNAEASANLTRVAFDSSTVSVTATSEDSMAHLTVNHGSGTVNGLTVAAGGEGEHGLQGFPYLGYFDDVGGFNAGRVLTLEIDGVTLSHTLSAGEAAAGYSADLAAIAADFNSQAAAAHLNVTIDDSGPFGTGLWIDFNDTSYHDAATFTVNGDTNSFDVLNWGGGAGQDAESHVVFQGGSDVTVGGEVQVSATAPYAQASAYFSDNSQATFDGATVSVSASNYRAEAYLDASHASGNIESLAVTSSGNDSFASADISASGTLTLGDTSVNSSDHSYASADLTGVTFSHAAIEVTATDSDAGLNASQAGGTIDSLTVSAHSNGDGDGGGAWAVASIHGSSDVTIGDLTVTAGGTYAEANLALGWDFSDDSSFQLTNSAIEVTASGRSHASLDVNYATGTIDGLSVVHNGDGATPQHEVQWFQFDSFFRREVDFIQGRVITVTIDGVTVSHTITASEENAGYESSITSVAADLNSKAHAAGLGVNISDVDNGELRIQFWDYQNHEMSVVNCNGTDGTWYWADLENPEEFGAIALIQGGSNVTVGGTVEVAATGDSGYASLNVASNSHVTFDNATVSATASGYSSEVYLETHANASGTIDSLAVEASNEDAYADVTLSASASGALTVGNVSISGASYNAEASATLTRVGFDYSTVSVTTVSEDSSAHLTVNHGTGAINSLNVAAGGAGEHEIQGFNYFGYFDDVGGFNAGRVLTLEIDGITLSHTLSAGEAAAGYSADLATIVADFNGQAAASHLGVTIADSGPFGPGLWIDFNDTSHHDNATFTFNGTSSSFDVLDGGGTGWNSEAYAVFQGGSDVRVGELQVSATAGYAQARAYFSDDSQVTFDNASVNVAASDYRSEAYLDASHASGDIDSLTVTAAAYRAEAGAALYGSSDVTVRDITVTASGEESHASADLAGYSGEGDNSDSHFSLHHSEIAVTSSGHWSEADLNVNYATGTISAFAVTAENGGDAEVNIYGTVELDGIYRDGGSDTLAVHASTGAYAEVDLYGNVNWYEDDPTRTVTLDDVRLEVASATSGDAELYLGDAVGSVSGITVSAADSGSYAQAEVDFTGTLNGAIAVTANGADTEAYLDLAAGVRTMAWVSWNALNRYDGNGHVEPNPDVIHFAAGQTYTLSVGNVVLSYTLQAGDIVNSDTTRDDDEAILRNLLNGLMTDADYATAGFKLQHGGDDTDATGRGFQVLWDDATSVHNSETLAFTMTDGNGTYDLAAEQGFGYGYDETHDGGAVTLDGLNTIATTADGTNAYAQTNLDNLSGTAGTITVHAESEAYSNHDGATAVLAVRFDQGGATTMNIEAVDIQDHASLYLSQPDAGSGTVTVSGDGHTMLALGDEPVAAVDLTELHANRWGTFDLEFLASITKTTDPSIGNAAAIANYLQSGSALTVTGFSTALDSITVAETYDDRTYNWQGFSGDDPDDDSLTTHTAPFYAENESDAGSYNALAQAALDALNGRSDTSVPGYSNTPGYYFGVYNGDGYLFYDRFGGGVTDVVKLEGVTSFDAVNVCAAVYDHDSVDWGTASEIGYYYYGAAVNLSDTFDVADARIENLIVSYGYNYWTGPKSSDLTLNAEMTGDTVTGSLAFRQSEIDVQGGGSGGDAHLTVNNAHGTIDTLHVWSDNSSVADANFDYFTGALHDAGVRATHEGTASIAIDGLVENVHHLDLYADASAASATLGFAAGHIEQTDITLEDHHDASAATASSATLEVYQTDHGGVVNIATGDHDYSGAMDATVTLTYDHATADSITLGHYTGGELADSSNEGLSSPAFHLTGGTLVAGGFDGAFHLNLTTGDQDYNHTDALANMVHVTGFDSGDALNASDNAHNDTIGFANHGAFLENLTAAASMEAFLTAADTHLDGSVDYYFGVVGGNGYLAYDQDGTGITQLVELVGVTNFDQSRIHEISV